MLKINKLVATQISYFKIHISHFPQPLPEAKNSAVVNLHSSIVTQLPCFFRGVQ